MANHCLGKRLQGLNLPDLAPLLQLAQELWGNPSVCSVVCGNATAEVTSTVVVPLGIWLGLEPAAEQPSSSLMFKWPGFLTLSNGCQVF